MCAIASEHVAEAPDFEGLDRETLDAVVSNSLFVWVPAAGPSSSTRVRLRHLRDVSGEMTKRFLRRQTG